MDTIQTMLITIRLLEFISELKKNFIFLVRLHSYTVPTHQFHPLDPAFYFLVIFSRLSNKTTMPNEAPEWEKRVSAVLSHKYSGHPNTVVKFKVKYSGFNIMSYITKEALLSADNGVEALKYYLRKKCKNRSLAKLLSFDGDLVPLAKMPPVPRPESAAPA